MGIWPPHLRTHPPGINQHYRYPIRPFTKMSSPVCILVINPNSNKGFTQGLEDLVANLGYTEVGHTYPSPHRQFACSN